MWPELRDIGRIATAILLAAMGLFAFAIGVIVGALL